MAAATSKALGTKSQPLDSQSGTQRSDQKHIDKGLTCMKQCIDILNNVKKDSPGLLPDQIATVHADIEALYKNTASLSGKTMAQAHDITLHGEFLERPAANVTYVNKASNVVELVDAIVALSKGAILYVDTEQDSLHHTSWMQIFTEQNNTVYMVDIHRLGQTAGTTASPGGQTLQSILESSTITKCFYDVRGNSHALFREFGIRMAGLNDLALWTAASYGKEQKFAIGLQACIETYAKAWFTTQQRDEWIDTKKAGHQMWNETEKKVASICKGGLANFTPPINERPLPAWLEKYCVGDVTVMPIIRKHMMERVISRANRGAWNRSIVNVTLKRTAASQDDKSAPSKEEAVKSVAEWAHGPHLA